MSTFVSASSMRAFPLSSPLFSKLRRPKATTNMAPAPPSSDWLGMLSIAACFIAAFVINILVLFGALSLLAPKLPLACLSIYGSGYALLLLIGHLEKKEEETWTLAMRTSQSDGDLAVVEDDEL